MDETVTVTELWVFPVKGMQGVRVDSVDITDLGIAGDREYTVWEDSRLVDQKADQWLASIAAHVDDATGALTLSHPTHGEFVHQRRVEGSELQAKWVLDEFAVIDQGDDVAQWLSSVLGREVRLVTAKEPWQINFPIPQMERLHQNPKVRFNAASPVSIANIASLGALNGHFDHAVGVDRFRMNVTIEGLDAYEEDHLEQLSNENVSMLSVAPAERCVIVTTDQKTGERPTNNMLRTLAAERMKSKQDRYGSGMKFGNYMAVDSGGRLSVGDRLNATFVPPIQP